MREDIWFQDTYSPTAAGEHRVRLNEFNVWEAERATYDWSGRLTWYAVPFEWPSYEAAVSAHQMMGKTLDNLPADASGYFLNEQLRQWAATLAARKVEQGVLPSAAVALALSNVKAIAAMPLLDAIVNLQRTDLLPDTYNAMQAQLLIHACKVADDPALISWALDIGKYDRIKWYVTEALEKSGNIVKHLQLSSPVLIDIMRQDLVNRTASSEADDVLRDTLWHFPEGTSISEVHEWLDQAANHPLEPSTEPGTVRVIRDLTGNVGAEQFTSDGEWNAIDTEHSIAKAAIGAYHWAQDHTPPMIENDPLKAAGFRQLAASLAGNLKTGPLEAVQIAIEQAKQQATQVFSCARELAYPERSDHADEGVHYQLGTLSEHRLTRAGIANHLAALLNNPNRNQQPLDALKLPLSNELAVGVSMADPALRLNLHCEPKVFLKVGNPTHGYSLQPIAGLAADLDAMSVATGLGKYQFDFATSLTKASPQPNEFKVELQKLNQSGADEQGASPELTIEVYEPDELVKLIREKGICPKASVAQLGDNSWNVSWRSETPEESREYFEQGIETYYTLNLLEGNGEPVNPEIARVFAEEVGVIFSNPYAPLISKGTAPKLG